MSYEARDTSGVAGIELLRTRTLAWTARELILASRADGRVLARWPIPVAAAEVAEDDALDGDADDTGEEEKGRGDVLKGAAMAWSTLASPERIAILLGDVEVGTDDPMAFGAEIAFVDPATGAIERTTRVFRESHALCGWSPDGMRLFASGMGRHEPRTSLSGDPAAALLAAIEAPGPAIPITAQAGLLAIDAATGTPVGELSFEDLPHCDRLVFRPDGRAALSRSTSQYQAHVARLDFEGTRVPRGGDPDAARIDGVSIRVGFASTVETARVRPLPGWRDAVVVESGYVGPRVVALWNVETGERGRVLFEIPEQELLDAPALDDGYPSILDAWPAGDGLVVIARGNGEIRVAPSGRVLPLRATAAERIAVVPGAVFVAEANTVRAMPLDVEAPAVVAEADAPIDAIAVDTAAGELIALTSSGALRAFRIPKS